jgi:hypothetical protein
MGSGRKATTHAHLPASITGPTRSKSRARAAAQSFAYPSFGLETTFTIGAGYPSFNVFGFAAQGGCKAAGQRFSGRERAGDQVGTTSMKGIAYISLDSPLTVTMFIDFCGVSGLHVASPDERPVLQVPEHRRHQCVCHSALG